MESDLKKIYEEFLDLVEKGSAEDAKNFLVERIPVLPKEVQDEIIFALFEGGITKAAQEDAAVAAVQRQTVQNFEALQRLQRQIEDRLKMIKIEKDLEQAA